MLMFHVGLLVSATACLSVTSAWVLHAPNIPNSVSRGSKCTLRMHQLYHRRDTLYTSSSKHIERLQGKERCKRLSETINTSGKSRLFDNNEFEFESENEYYNRKSPDPDDYDSDIDEDGYNRYSSSYDSDGYDSRDNSGRFRDEYDGIDPDYKELQWESCPTKESGTAYVLLPPASQRPTAIIHFVGGTFFGSSPTIWYGTLLEEIVFHSGAIVVATSIPVTVLQSPLDHVQLAKKISRQFQTAYLQVLVDEYEKDGHQNHDFLESLPVCALGHSLGSRLLVILATLSPTSTSRQRRRNRNSDASQFSRLPPTFYPLYKSFLLMSFTNFGAAAGIPGVGALFRARQKVNRRRRKQHFQRRRKQEELDQKLYERRRSVRSNRFKNSKEFGDDDDDDDDDDNDDDDEDFSLWQDLKNAVSQSAQWIQSSLTPGADALEFHPTPAQLWTAISTDEESESNSGGRGGGRYKIPHTLLIQFDQDRSDQSSKLATTLAQMLPSSQNASISSVPYSTSTASLRSIRFARLRGTHLTPVSIKTSAQSMLGNESLSIDYNHLDNANEIPRRDQKALSDLRQTIVRYVTEVVAKENYPVE